MQQKCIYQISILFIPLLPHFLIVSIGSYLVFVPAAPPCSCLSFYSSSGPRLSSVVALYVFPTEQIKEQDHKMDCRGPFKSTSPPVPISFHSPWCFNNALVSHTVAFAHSQPLYIQCFLPGILLPILAFTSTFLFSLYNKTQVLPFLRMLF